MKSKRRIRTALIFVLAVVTAFAFTMADITTVYGAGKASPAASSATTFKTSTDAGDYLKVDALQSGGVLQVQCKHSQAMNKMVVRLISYSESGKYTNLTIISKDDSTYDATAELKAGGVWTRQYDPKEMQIDSPDSKNLYWIFIYKVDSSDPVGDYLPIIKGPVVKIQNGICSLMEYKTIETTNTKVSKTVTATKHFKAKDLSDLHYLLFHKKGSKTAKRTIKSTTEKALYKKVGDSIVSKAGATSAYAKAKAIYTWVASNFYYDKYATAGGHIAYDDPYYNLKYQQDGSGNSYNAKSGKVAVWCDGYAGIYTALVRSQGIPCRIINGFHIDPSGGKSWSSSTGGVHCWTEVYAGGKWIAVDPCSGSYNKYSKESGENSYTYKKSTKIAYQYFNMTDAAKANCLCGKIVSGVWMTIAKVAQPTVKKYSKKKVKVIWKKVKNATKYEIYVSAKKKSGYKKIKVTGNVKSAVINGTRFHKRYYKVRGYGFQNGARVNGAWSTPRAITLK